MAGSIDEVITKLRDMTECPICLEQFKEPRTLPCQHSFCTECLDGLLGRGQMIKCPCCNNQTRVPNGIRELPVDFRANSWLEILANYERAKAARGAESEAAAAQETVHGAEAAIPEEAFAFRSLDKHCPVCEEILTASKNLSCGHSLCRNCAQFMLPVGGDTLYCPTCSHQTRIVTTSITGPYTPSGQSQGGATCEAVDLSRLLPMLESLTRSIMAQGPSQQPTAHALGSLQSQLQNLPSTSTTPLPANSPVPSAPPYPMGPPHTPGIDIPHLPPPSQRRPVFSPTRDEPQVPLPSRQHSRTQAEIAPAESRLTFHPSCGRNVIIHDNQITAQRNPPDSWGHSLVLTSRHLKPNEYFEVTSDKRADSFSWSICIGVTTQTPTEAAGVAYCYDLGSGTWYMCNKKVWHKEGDQWAKIRGYMQWYLEAEERVGVMRRENGDLHFYINGTDRGVAARRVPADVYGVVAINGNCQQVTIIQPSERHTGPDNSERHTEPVSCSLI